MTHTNDIKHQTSPRQVASPAACLGGSHGYRFEGDLVHLHSNFSRLTEAAHGLNWALQLWACPQMPEVGALLLGVLVAEVDLPPLGEITDPVETFGVSAFALPPAGQSSHVMVLALVSRRGPDRELHDLAIYPASEQFVLPRFASTTSFSINGDTVLLNLGSIENPRDAFNYSGTLSAELWALAKPYTGGAFEGQPLAGAILGSLAGDQRWENIQLSLPFARPAEGVWNLVLMLREWTVAGYVTRDFVNFSQQVAFQSTTLIPTETTAQLPETSTSCTPVEAASATEEESAAPTEASRQKDAETKKSEGIAINSASLDELRQIKGLSANAAKNLIKERPYSSLDELVRVKGIGSKMLAKIRQYLCLD